jgi:predicted 3-demethylubiquinone-9 3-methyltransferase (glyoxalase superfamily)
MPMPGITPCLWFDGRAQEAAQFYTGIFPNSRIDRIDRSAADNPSVKEDEVLTVSFTLDGAPFMGLNGGPDFKFNEAISLFIECADQAEVDRYWEALTADGGEPGPCGWLKDRFGVSWQVVPAEMMRLLYDSDDRDAARRAMNAMLQMKKIDLEQIRAAYEDRTPVGAR